MNLSGWICQGSVEWPLGKLAAVEGDLETAIEHLQRAVERNHEQGIRCYQARALVDLGGVLLERDAPGDAPAARTALVQATELVDEIGLEGLRRLARDRLNRAAGVPTIATTARNQR